jgi:alkanesulfonate monooxygenase SsuD/methylene tetrahydromethanopterin reductase-like flavin-dependent oxidoreductase (luciferase family)
MVMQFGLHVGMSNTSMSELKDLAQFAEELGFSWVSVFDHIYSSNGTSGRHCPEALVMHTYLASVTQRVRCGCLVYVAAYRSPGLLAKSIATIDEISNGRVTLGLGAGWNRREFKAYGIPFLPASNRSDQLAEYARVVKGLLHDSDPLVFSGKHYQYDQAVCEPRPVQPKLPLWMGGVGELRTLPLVAELADGWNATLVTPDVFARKRAILERHCEANGRAIGTIVKSVNVGLAWSEDSLRIQYGRRADEVCDAVLMGTPEKIADRIREYSIAGVDQINISIRATQKPAARALAHDFDGLSRIGKILSDANRELIVA